MNVKITQALLDSLTAQAQASPRLRMNKDLRNSADDKSQRMLNAIEPGGVLPIHRHLGSSENGSFPEKREKVDERWGVERGEGGDVYRTKCFV